MSQLLPDLLRQLGSILFPRVCHLCKEFIHDEGCIDICCDCYGSIVPLTSPKCTCCGASFLSDAAEDHLCGSCIDDPPPFARARAALKFEGSTRELVHQFKYGRRVLLRKPLAMIALTHFSDFPEKFRPDLIIPVPLHLKRLKERGFNQAILLGEVFSRRWSIPLARNSLQRIRWTEPQVNLGAAEREVNVKGAFAVSDIAAVNGRSILLIDDVYTTGSTVKECSRVLNKAGAAEVSVITIARGNSL